MILTYATQDTGQFTDPAVPPGHAIVVCDGFGWSCRLFWAHFPPLNYSDSRVSLTPHRRLQYQRRPGAALFPRRGQWLESIADCNVSQINKLRYKVIKQSAADNITEKLDCKIFLDKNNAVRTLERRYLSDAAALITVLYRQKAAKYNPNLSGSLSNFLFLK